MRFWGPSKGNDVRRTGGGRCGRKQDACAVHRKRMSHERGLSGNHHRAGVTGMLGGPALRGAGSVSLGVPAMGQLSLGPAAGSLDVQEGDADRDHEVLSTRDSEDVDGRARDHAAPAPSLDAALLHTLTDRGAYRGSQEG